MAGHESCSGSGAADEEGGLDEVLVAGPGDVAGTAGGGRAVWLAHQCFALRSQEEAQGRRGGA